MDEDELSEDERRLLAWRLNRILDLGYTLSDSQGIVAAGIDYHELARLIADGCSAELAQAILS